VAIDISGIDGGERGRGICRNDQKQAFGKHHLSRRRYPPKDLRLFSSRNAFRSISADCLHAYSISCCAF
jgi:hypothetical protein